MTTDFSNIALLTYNDTIVLTTEQLAIFYGCSVRQIKQNFNNNKERFVEGDHYFKLKGEELKIFKDKVQAFNVVGKNANVLCLWTKRGAALHAKMLNNDRAWKVYELFEENYFERKMETNAPTSLTEEEISKLNLPPHLKDTRKNCVYALALANDTVKIGRSSNFFRRANEIKRQVHLDIIDSYHTGYLPYAMAADIEKNCHHALSFCHIKSEIFKVSFAEACAVVSKQAKSSIEIYRGIYEKRWADSGKLYDQFLREIPVPPGAETFADSNPAQIETANVAKEKIVDVDREITTKEKIAYLLECARLATSDEQKKYFLQRIDTLL